jgi:hypothetical protein
MAEMASGPNVCAVALGLMLLGLTPPAKAEDAKAIIQQAVNSELAAAKADRSLWRYRMQEDGGTEYVVVETTQGSIKRHIKEDGHPASPATIQADNDQIQKFIHDPSLQAKQKRDGAHDDKSATELLNEMPEAFLWTVVSEAADTTTLRYTPNPNFSPPDMESRVMGGMTGTLVVTKEGQRIKTFKGRLENDVTIGYGLLARLKAGSTFDVERRLVAEGYWEITETHVHIGGHALFFKTIGTQQDEVKQDFTSVPAGTTLEQAVHLLDEPLK